MIPQSNKTHSRRSQAPTANKEQAQARGTKKPIPTANTKATEQRQQSEPNGRMCTPGTKALTTALTSCTPGTMRLQLRGNVCVDSVQILQTTFSPDTYKSETAKGGAVGGWRAKAAQDIKS